jgi:hypothetical protein
VFAVLPTLSCVSSNRSNLLRKVSHNLDC